MVQTGGNNGSAIVHLESGGEYNLVEGDFAANTYFDGGVFRQQGGRINTGLGIYRGTYRLENGIIYGGASVPTSDGFSAAGGGALMLQTGGTNAGSLDVGYIGGYGTYVLSNGLSFGAGLTIGARGAVQQWEGTQIVTGAVTLITDYVARQTFGSGSYSLNGGNLSAGMMDIGGHYTQNGGTNVTAGGIRIWAPYADVHLSGGEMRAANTDVAGAWQGGYFQSGGRHVVANQLSVEGGTLPLWLGYVMSGGELVVSNIVLAPASTFTKTGGVVSQSGLLTMEAATLNVGGGTHHFGPMNLQCGSSQQTNSAIHLSNSVPCVLTFGDSHSVVWSNKAALIITDWTGSWTGGGSQQIFFGSTAEGLTSTQLSQILFKDPPGMNPGWYAARILPNGEVVPDAVPPTGHIASILTLARVSGGAMQLTIRGELSAGYGIYVSSNLVNWTAWTNVTTPSGTATVQDAPGGSARFYRAVLLP